MKARVSAGHQTKKVEVRLGGTGGIGPQAAATAALRLAFKDNQGSHGWSSVYLDPNRFIVARLSDAFTALRAGEGGAGR